MHFPEKDFGFIDKVYDRYGSKVDVSIIAVKHKSVETHNCYFVKKKKKKKFFYLTTRLKFAYCVEIDVHIFGFQHLLLWP